MYVSLPLSALCLLPCGLGQASSPVGSPRRLGAFEVLLLPAAVGRVVTGPAPGHFHFHSQEGRFPQPETEMLKVGVLNTG